MSALFRAAEIAALPPPDPLLRVRGLTKEFSGTGGTFFKKSATRVRAVDDVSFDLWPGEALGLVGESGSGKTTTARCILRALDPTAGDVLFRCRDGAIVNLATLPERALKPLRPQMQMVFQDPVSSLNPRMTVGAIVAEPLEIHNLARGTELDDRVEDVLRRVGLEPEHRGRYPHAFSVGQRQRIAIARALVMRPSLIVADEAVSSLDVSVQAQVLNLLKDLQSEFRLTYLFVAHNLDVVRHFCDRVAVMYDGRIVEQSRTAEIFERPLHPYTKALLSAVPWADPDARLAVAASPEAVDAAVPPEGCAFRPRCPDCFERCLRDRPELFAAAPGRLAACHLHDPAFQTQSRP
jgi:peptide/nickel transport system ATP-binding protein